MSQTGSQPQMGMGPGGGMPLGDRTMSPQGNNWQTILNSILGQAGGMPRGVPNPMPPQPQTGGQPPWGGFWNWLQQLGGQNQSPPGGAPPPAGTPPPMPPGTQQMSHPPPFALPGQYQWRDPSVQMPRQGRGIAIPPRPVVPPAGAPPGGTPPPGPWRLPPVGPGGGGK